MNDLDRDTLLTIADFGVGEFIMVTTLITTTVIVAPIMTARWWYGY